MPQRVLPSTQAEQERFPVVFFCWEVFFLILLSEYPSEDSSFMQCFWFHLATLLSPKGLSSVPTGLLQSKLLVVLVNMWPQDPSFHHQFSMCFSSSAFSSGPGDCFYFLVNSAKWVEGSCSIYLSYQIFFLIVYLNARCRPVCFPLLCSYLSPNPANIPQFIPEQF